MTKQGSCTDQTPKATLRSKEHKEKMEALCAKLAKKPLKNSEKLVLRCCFVSALISFFVFYLWLDFPAGGSVFIWLIFSAIAYPVFLEYASQERIIDEKSGFVVAESSSKNQRENSSIVEDLEKLSALFKDGDITEEEYNTAKKKVMS